MSNNEKKLDAEMVRVLDGYFSGEESVRDKDGNEVSEQVEAVMRALKRKTQCHKVLCHWNHTERVGYWSKYNGMKDVVFAVIKQEGFRVSNIGTRVIEVGIERRESEVMYAEFIPVEPSEEEGQ